MGLTFWNFLPANYGLVRHVTAHLTGPAVARFERCIAEQQTDTYQSIAIRLPPKESA
jgi:hypothetical protein